MPNKPITILHLYPRSMNIYGDWGNVLALQRRLEWRGVRVEVIEYNEGDTFPDGVDIIIGGGGQDSGQEAVHDDLLRIGDTLKELAANGTPMLMICGMYQLFGKSFTTASGRRMEGIGIFDAETVATNQRMIGNTIIETEDFGTIVGFENHSGITTLQDQTSALGTVRLGAGNNGSDGTEGARHNNVVGSYLHGSLLPKNPRLADWLIETALTNRGDQTTLEELDDQLEQQAHQSAKKRPR